jgi:hypothetical protein
VVPAWSALSTGSSIGQRLARRIWARSNGFKFHIPRGWIYFAIAFSAAVELFNVFVKRNRKNKAWYHWLRLAEQTQEDVRRGATPDPEQMRCC